ncbi:MAG: cytochrome c biogenesis protein CcdA [Synergistales bacterium]|nr:cytochrome c biogenesis protein CcdA [Synergistales bacterium]
MIDGWLQLLSASIAENMIFAPLLALIAGLLTAFTPCSLTSVPLVIGYVGGTGKENTRKAFRLSLVFSLGMALTFTALGVTASLIGKFLNLSSSLWYLFLGAIMLLMSLQVLELFQWVPSFNFLALSTKRGYVGALVAGVLGGLFSSPCATPVLVVLLSIVARSGDLLWGVLLLLLYSLGHSALVLAAGTSVGFASTVTGSDRYRRSSQILKCLMGLSLLSLAFYMFYLGF